MTCFRAWWGEGERKHLCEGMSNYCAHKSMCAVLVHVTIRIACTLVYMCVLVCVCVVSTGL